jgi:hypothetical protein
MLKPVGPPRKPILRVLLAGLLEFAVVAPAATLATVIDDAGGGNLLRGLATWLIFAVPMAWLAPKVSYRRRDALIGPLFFHIVAWRIAFLPHRDWAPRYDEVAQARYLREPQHAGIWQLADNAAE